MEFEVETADNLVGVCDVVVAQDEGKKPIVLIAQLAGSKLFHVNTDFESVAKQIFDEILTSRFPDISRNDVSWLEFYPPSQDSLFAQQGGLSQVQLSWDDDAEEYHASSWEPITKEKIQDLPGNIRASIEEQA